MRRPGNFRDFFGRRGMRNPACGETRLACLSAFFFPSFVMYTLGYGFDVGILDFREG